MPLDTQPLSPTRRWLMLAVLLALFAASLAFAQYLVVKKGQKPTVKVDLSAAGFSVRQGESLPDEVQALTGAVAGHPRRIDVFSWPANGAVDPEDVEQAAGDLFNELMNAPAQETILADLGGIPGVQAQGPGPHGRFAMVRAVAADDRIVAICYSGPVPYTDADKETFGTLCATGVKLNPSSPNEAPHERK